MSTTQTEKYVFRNIPIEASGKVTFARVSGEVMWRIGERPDGWELISMRDLYVACEDGSLVEIPEDDETLWMMLYRALGAHLRASPKRSSAVDKSDVEGAEQTSG